MITREQVFEFLLEKQEIIGGYTGNDLTILAEQSNVAMAHPTAAELRGITIEIK